MRLSASLSTSYAAATCWNLAAASASPCAARGAIAGEVCGGSPGPAARRGGAALVACLVLVRVVLEGEASVGGLDLLLARLGLQLQHLVQVRLQLEGLAEVARHAVAVLTLAREPRALAAHRRQPVERAALPKLHPDVPAVRRPLALRVALLRARARGAGGGGRA